MKKLLILLILFSSCDIQKRAVKTKTQTETQTDVAKSSTNKTFDFSKSTSENESWSYEPADPRELMTVITSKGDTIKTSNTKITKSKNRTKTNYNKQTEAQTDTIDKTLTNEDTLSKERESEHNFDASVILYGFIGLGILLVIVGLFVTWKLDKYMKIIIPKN